MESIPDLVPGTKFPDLELPAHTGRERSLTEVAARNPLALFTARGWWCPKEQRYMRELIKLQNEFEVAYTQIVLVTIDDPETQSAFRAGLGARFAPLFPGTVVETDLFGVVSPPAGPLIERVTGAPWPGGRFPAAELNRS